MKSHYEGTRSSFSLHSAWKVMLDKSNSRNLEIQRINARNIESNRTSHAEQNGEYVTDHAYDLLNKQLALSKKCVAIQYDTGLYLVYTSESQEEIENYLPPR